MAKNQSKVAGGVARANKLSAEQRAEIAKKAAGARWGGDLPKATHGAPDRPLVIGGAELVCYVLDDGTRLITQEGFLTALGRAKKAKGGHGASVEIEVDKLPSFLAANNLKPFIHADVAGSTTPIVFRTPAGAKAYGYRADLLPKVCNVYLSARDANVILPSQRHIVTAADMLMRGLAEVGIIALVDEATGYQEVRDRKALQAILDRYLAKELATWAKRFPDEFYQQMFRLRGWAYNPSSVQRPGVVGTYTVDLVYERLAPGLVEELERINPKHESGARKNKHHQWLTSDVGHPALAQHLHAVIGLMRASSGWDDFIRMLDRAFPKKGHTIPMMLE